MRERSPFRDRDRVRLVQDYLGADGSVILPKGTPGTIVDSAKFLSPKQTKYIVVDHSAERPSVWHFKWWEYDKDVNLKGFYEGVKEAP